MQKACVRLVLRACRSACSGAVLAPAAVPAVAAVAVERKRRSPDAASGQGVLAVGMAWNIWGVKADLHWISDATVAALAAMLTSPVLPWLTTLLCTASE
eukprot:5642416-Amphidinium_carterae.1